MDATTLMDGPGYFSVLSQPKAHKFEEDYHDWYNKEHGPLRLKLDFFRNGYRYKSLDKGPPAYLACYDLARISGLQESEYTELRENRSEREEEVICNKLKKLDRRIYADISTRGEFDGPAPVIMCITLVVKDDHLDELNRWYEEV